MGEWAWSSPEDQERPLSDHGFDRLWPVATGWAQLLWTGVPLSWADLQEGEGTHISPGQVYYDYS